MKNLRGRPPRNIYLDSDDGEDSDYSDSDIEPVFFPAADFENDFDEDVVQEYSAGFLNALDRLHQLAAEDSSSNSSDDSSITIFSNSAPEDGDGEEVDHPPPYDYLSGAPVPDSPDYRIAGSEPVFNPNINHPTLPNAAEEDNLVWQYFRGTAQVRHIVHDSFAIIQQQRQEITANQAGGASSSSDSSRFSIRHTTSAAENAAPIGPRTRADSLSDSHQEPSTSAATSTRASPSPEGSKMTEQSSGEASVGDEISKLEQDKTEDDGSKKSPSSASSNENDSNKPSSLVPYPDLPDYASAGEEDDDLRLDNKRQSLKRKEPDNECSDDDEDKNPTTRETPGSSSKSTKTLNNRQEPEPEVNNQDDDEETCNPMASDTEEFDEEAITFRGDRIGNTMYSERHVLKILMLWLENLPQYSVDKLMDAREKEESEEVIEKTILRLGTEFEEQMSLLWDMSAELDVMNFLVENKIYSFIRDTIDRSACSRLTEIALGILANIISEPSVLDDFNVHDASMGLLERVVELCWKVSDVAVLIQVFSVLRRVVWYIRNVANVKRWTELMTSSNFIESANFILRSSTNQLLLGNVFVLFFALIDCLNTENDCDDEDEESQENHSNPESNTSSERRDKEQRLQLLAKNYEPFCKSDFVTSLCEGLKELMKNPKPKNIRKNLTSTREKPAGPSASASGGQTEDHYTNADEIDVPIPEGHVQQAILKGFSALALLQKALNGKETLKNHAPQVINAILDFLRIFIICTDAVTRSDSLEYFTLSLHLLSFCHVSLEEVNVDAIVGPVTTASKLVCREEKDKEVDMAIRVQLKDGVEFDSVSYIALVTHEYLAAVAEKFGPDCALEVRNNPSHAKFFRVIDKVVSKFTEENGTATATTSNNGNDALT